MKRRKMTILAASILSISFCAVAGGFIVKGNENNSFNTIERASATVLNTNTGGAGALIGEGTYYSGISDSLSGEDLLNALHTLNTQKRTRTVGYNGFRQFAATCDADPDGSGKIIGFYDNAKIGPSWDSGSTWNREHVWPNVRDGDKVENDAHMVRPAATSTNSDRGSKGFGTDSYDPGKDVAYYRGAAARIIFYAAIADTSLKVVDYSFPYNGVQNGNHGYDVGTMGSLSDMLQWNLQYLPSDTSFTGANDLARRTELSRNEKIQTASGGQGNRNPFIDHPEYACKIWGNTNAKTKQICGMSQDSTVTLSKTSATVEVGQTTTITATSSNGGTITWTKSNNNINLSATSVASGTAITITGVTAGSTTITAKNGNNVSAMATITVNQAGTTEPLTLSATELAIEIGGQASLTASTNDNSFVTFSFDEIGKKILRSSKSYSDSGVPITLTGLRDGTAVITAKAENGATATCTVKVGTGKYVPNGRDGGSSSNKNLPLIIGLSAGGGTILIAGLVVLVVILVKRKKVI